MILTSSIISSTQWQAKKTTKKPQNPKTLKETQNDKQQCSSQNQRTKGWKEPQGSSKPTFLVKNTV